MARPEKKSHRAYAPYPFDSQAAVHSRSFRFEGLESVGTRIFLWTFILVGEPSPTKRVKGQYWGT